VIRAADIGRITSAVDFLRNVVRLPKVGLFAPSGGNSDEVVSSYGVVSTGRYSAFSAVTDVLKIAPGPKGFVANFAYQVSQHRCYEREIDGLTEMVAF
jgi:catalase